MSSELAALRRERNRPRARSAFDLSKFDAEIESLDPDEVRCDRDELVRWTRRMEQLADSAPRYVFDACSEALFIAEYWRDTLRERAAEFPYAGW